MPSQTRSADAPRSNVPDDWFDGQKRFCVILEKIRPDIETPESFAIKFSLLTKIPISRVKLMVVKLPAQIWVGQGKRKAQGILNLIEEAGGLGKVIEGAVESPAAAKRVEPEPAAGLTCRWCGFPLKEGETRCGFCMMTQGKTEKTAREPMRERVRGTVSAKRFIWYGIALVVVVIMLLIVTR